MKNTSRKSLSERRRKIADDAAAQIINGKEDNLAPINTKLDVISKILTVLPARKKLTDRTGIVLIIAFVILVAFLWINKKTSNALQLDIQSKTIDTRLREDWYLEAPVVFQGNYLNMERMNSIRNLILGIDLESPEDDAWIQIRADSFELVEFFISAGENLSIGVINSGGASVTSLGPKITGRIQIYGNVEIYGGLGDQINIMHSDSLADPEPIDFMVDNNGRDSSRIEFPASSSWSFGGMCIDNLAFGFNEPRINDTAFFTSSIIGGKLQLPEVSSEKMLYRRDPLELRGIKGRLAELSIGDTIRSVYVGCVNEVNVEFKATTRNLAPSVLEYFYYNARSKFLLSLIVPIWGAIIGIRRLFNRE